MAVYDAPDDEGEGAPRQSYNFAPGYYGMVYRADTPDWGAGPARERRGVHGQDRSEETDDQEDASAAAADREGQGEDEGDHEAAAEAAPAQGPQDDIKYRLQSMKWGLIPFWTKRNPDYASMMRTINCRDDSLSTPGGMWATMKARKRCIVIAEGFYEWLRVGPKERVPHYIKRKDGQLLLLAGLWDCVQYEGTFQLTDGLRRTSDRRLWNSPMKERAPDSASYRVGRKALHLHDNHNRLQSPTQIPPRPHARHPRARL